MKWRFSAPAGGVEGSKFCLFSVVLPARCVSSVSPRFHYRRQAFCFLPLAAILEFHPDIGRMEEQKKDAEVTPRSTTTVSNYSLQAWRTWGKDQT
jgi:hypothetical protein